MSTPARTPVRTNTAARYASDPFALARDFFAWEPFVTRSTSAFVPTFEVKETADAFLVRADVPGVREEDLDVSLHHGVLSISGQRHAEERKEGESYSLLERQFGAFSRSFALPETADGEQIEATLEAGVLALRIGKKVQAQPRRITLGKRA